MKRILSLTVASILLLSTLAFVSCSKEPEPMAAPDIYGKAPAEAYAEAMTYIDNGSSYQVVFDITATVKTGVINIPIKANDVYEYSYSGRSAHHVLSKSGEMLLGNKLLSGIAGEAFSFLNKELWYVDGILYRHTLSDEYLMTEDPDPTVINSPIETAIDDIVTKNMDKTLCYTSGDRAYFEVVLTAGDTRLGDFDTESYRVYLSADGRIEEMRIICDASKYNFDISLAYAYEDISISAPENVNDFTFVEGP